MVSLLINEIDHLNLTMSFIKLKNIFMIEFLGGFFVLFLCVLIF